MTPLPARAETLLWQPLKEGGLGFTAAKHLAGTAFLASWKQNGPAVLRNLGYHQMQPLLQATPTIHNLITQACNLVDPTFLVDFTQMQPTTTPQRHTHRSNWPWPPVQPT